MTSHIKQLDKELKKKEVNTKAVKELQQLTFHERKIIILNLKGKDTFDQATDRFPFFV